MPRISEQPSCGQPKVSVALITYNHEKFIAQAIESVLLQETDFPVELIIGEDFSTDGTRLIVQEYAQKFPNVIQAILRRENVGPSKNFAATLEACKGQYIAILEGDDFWTDEKKLASQVRFLEANTECVMCFHDADILTGNDSSNETTAFYNKRKPKPRISFADHANGFVPPTCTCLFANDRQSLKPALTGELICFATTVFYCLTSTGKLTGFMPERMAAYRMHPGGIWSPLAPQNRQLMAIRVAESAYQYFKRLDKAVFFEPRLFDLHLWFAVHQLKTGCIGAALKNYSASFNYVFSSLNWPRVRLFSSTHLRCLRHLASHAVRRFYKPKAAADAK